MRQFVLLDGLHHFQAGDLLPVEARNDSLEEFRRPGGQLCGALGNRFPQGAGQFGGARSAGSV